ncbi:MAG: hypothetical protein ACYTGC_16345 [Planctomycetota bacterium]|jgi:hypothetical protein
MSSPDQSHETFSWQAHPAREHRGRAVAALAVVAAMAALSGLMMQSVGWGLLALLLLLAALNRFFLPTRFAIDDEGITARYPLRRMRFRWVELRRFALDDHGGYLSTRARRSWTDGYKGMHLLFGRQRDAVIEQIRAHMAHVGGTAGGESWAS